MTRKEYEIKDFDMPSVVYETARQKDILDVLDEMLENALTYGQDYIFEDASFYIEYKDGTSYYIDSCQQEGIYRKKNISRIIYNNCIDTQVFGKYDVNEWGIVS